MVKTLIIDSDETAVDFFTPVLEGYYEKTGIRLCVNDITDYNMTLFGITTDMWRKHGFFENLKPFPYAVEVLSRLSKKCKIIIATHALGIDFIKREKLINIAENFPFIDGVIFGNEKADLGDIIFDDGPKHLRGFKGVTVKRIRAYNSLIETDYETDNWLSFEKIVNGFLNEESYLENTNLQKSRKNS